jgi:gliding motility-associated-like protein
MADQKISQLTASTTPLAGTEVLPIVQSGVTKKTSVESVLTSVQPSGTANGVTYLNGSKVLTSGSVFTFDGTNVGVGTYSVTVTDSLGCQATSEITVISSSPSAGISLNSDVIITENQLSLQSTSTAGLFPINSWNWSFGDGNTSDIENPSHSYSEAGNYIITLVVTDELGCADTTSILIVVVGDIFIPNVVTPNSDNTNDIFLIQNLDITLPSKLIVLNRWGNVVFEIENYQNDWSPINLIDGVYFYQFDYTNKQYHGFFHVFGGE